MLSTLGVFAAFSTHYFDLPGFIGLRLNGKSESSVKLNSTAHNTQLPADWRVPEPSTQAAAHVLVIYILNIY